MKDLKLISSEREYSEFEEIGKFEYKGKTYKRVMYSSLYRDGANTLHIEDENGNKIEDWDEGIDGYSVDDVEDWISKNVKEEDIQIYGIFNYENVKKRNIKAHLSNDYENILITLIQKSKVKDEYHNIGDIVSSLEYNLCDVLDRLINNEKIGGWDVDAKDYEFELRLIDNKNERVISKPNNLLDWYEEVINQILGMKIHQRKEDDIEVSEILNYKN